MKQKSLSQIPASELNQQIRKLARLDQQTTAELIGKLAECERRRTYLEEGHRSLFAFLTQGLGYSEREACDRMNAARICMDVPTLQEGLTSGLYSLTQVSQVQAAVKREEKISGKKVTSTQKKDLIEKIQGLSTRQTEVVLSENLESAFQGKHKNRVHVKPLHDGKIELTLQISRDTFLGLERVQEIFSHLKPGADLVDVLETMISDVRKRKDLGLPKKSHSAKIKQQDLNSSTPKGPEGPSQKTSTQSFNVKREKAIPAAIKRAVFLRDQGQCQHKKPDGSICGSSYLIQFDHLRPRFAGGSNLFENLQLLCSVHNREKYRKQAGLKFIWTSKSKSNSA